MTEKHQITLRRVTGIVLSVLTVIAGVLLIVQSQRIYRSAEITPYSYEKAKNALSEIAAFLFLWIAAVVAGWVIFEIFPAPTEKPRARFDRSEILKRLQKRVPENLAQGSEVLRKAKRAEKIVWGVCVGCCAICAALVALVVWNKKYYTPVGDGFNPTRDMIGMLPRILPWIVIAFAAAAFATIFTERLAKKETTEIKKLLAENRGVSGAAGVSGASNASANKSQKDKRTLYIVRGVLLACGIAFMIIGANNGGAKEMLEKAINICTECIGLG